MIQSQLEIGYLTESVGLPLECLDFVIDFLNQAARDAVKIVVQKPVAVIVGDLFQLFDAGVFSINAPHIYECNGFSNGLFFEELSELPPLWCRRSTVGDGLKQLNKMEL